MDDIKTELVDELLKGYQKPDAYILLPRFPKFLFGDASNITVAPTRV